MRDNFVINLEIMYFSSCLLDFVFMVPQIQ